MNHRTTTAPAGLLPVWSTPDSSRHLLMALINSLAVASATGLILLLPLENGHVTLIALVAHLVSGALALIFFLPFLYTHMRDGKEPLRNLLLPWRLHRRVYREEVGHHRLIGYFLTLLCLLLFVGGLAISAPAIAYLSGRPFILPFGMSALLLRIHQVITVLFLAFLALHLWRRAKS